MGAVAGTALHGPVDSDPALVGVMVRSPLGIFIAVHIRPVMMLRINHPAHAERSRVGFINLPRIQQNPADHACRYWIIAKGQGDPFPGNVFGAQLRIPGQTAVSVQISLGQQMAGPVPVIAHIGHCRNPAVPVAP
ncbi:hypothetical protein D3C81_1779320 [compost metagenome]